MSHHLIKQWVFRVTILLTSVACVITAHAAKLEEVFNSEMLGTTQRYFESIAGIPIRKLDDDTFHFVVGGCNVQAFIKDESVHALRLSLEPNCQVDLGFLGLVSSTNKLTFGEFPHARYFSDCLYLCGNAFDPSVYALWEGPRSSNFIEVMLETISGFEAGEKWREHIEQQMGEDYVMDLRFNCEDTFSNVAAQAFENVEVEAITIGHDLLASTPTLNSLTNEYACGQ